MKGWHGLAMMALAIRAGDRNQLAPPLRPRSFFDPPTIVRPGGACFAPFGVRGATRLHCDPRIAQPCAPPMRGSLGQNDQPIACMNPRKFIEVTL